MNNRILLYGMKRSGNHGIINWLRAQLPCVFVNNIVPIAPIITGRQNMPKAVVFDQWLIERHLSKIKGDDFSAVDEKLDLTVHQPNVLASIEDHQVDLKPFENDTKTWQTVLVLRDPVNMLASRFKRAEKLQHPAYPRTDGPLLNRVVQTWKNHAQEFLGLTQSLPNKTNIYFNAWFADPAYRRGISHQMGLSFSDQGFTTVSKEGGGSSFEGTSKSGASQRMQVLARKSLLNDQQQALIDQVMRDSEMVDLAAAVAATTQ